MSDTKQNLPSVERLRERLKLTFDDPSSRTTIEMIKGRPMVRFASPIEAVLFVENAELVLSQFSKPENGFNERIGFLVRDAVFVGIRQDHATEEFVIREFAIHEKYYRNLYARITAPGSVLSISPPVPADLAHPTRDVLSDFERNMRKIETKLSLKS